MTYLSQLPSLFPYVAQWPVEDVQAVANLLMEKTAEFPSGSSFAVTADALRDNRLNLWLSQSSYERLVASGRTWYRPAVVSTSRTME